MEDLRGTEPRTIDDQVRICEVEAPPFKEAKRAAFVAQMFKDIGLTNVRIDKRGVKYLFREGLKGQIDRFVSIDGTGLGITNTAVGSLRYRVTFKGPGGHSYGASRAVRRAPMPSCTGNANGRARPRV